MGCEPFEHRDRLKARQNTDVGRSRVQEGGWAVNTTTNIALKPQPPTTTPNRTRSQWEEDAALRGGQAAKQAELAAAELAKLSQRMQQHGAGGGGGAGGPGGAGAGAAAAAGGRRTSRPGGAAAADPGGSGPTPEGGGPDAAPGGGGGGGGASQGGAGWGLTYLLGALVKLLINRLQLNVNNVHIFFQVGGRAAGGWGR
jgi:hypothetical protein